MRLPKTKLRTLLGAIGLIAYSLGTLGVLRHPSFATLKVVELALVCSMLFGIVAARYVPGRSGAFWFGYSVWSVPIYVYIHNRWQVSHLVDDLMSPLAMAMHFVATSDPHAALTQGERFEIIGAVYNDVFASWMGGLGGVVAMLMASRYGAATKRGHQA